MPPASAKAIASLIWRRSKYLSRIGADGTVRAELARALLVLRSQAEITGGDARGCLAHAVYHQRVIWFDAVLLAAAQIEQDQLGFATAGQQAAVRGQAVDPQLERVRRHQRRVERGIRLEVDQRDIAVDLADPVD